MVSDRASYQSGHSNEPDYKLDALIDLICIDESEHPQISDPSPLAQEVQERNDATFDGHGLLIDLSAHEAGPGPNTLDRIVNSNQESSARLKSKPDFRRIRQLIDDEAPSSPSDIEGSYELDTHFLSSGERHLYA
jgi:hypothetical protein